MERRPGELTVLIAGLGALAGATVVYQRYLHVTNATTVALTFLMIVLLVATTARLRTAIALSFAAMLSFNFFFLPPVGTFAISDLHNWVALFAFLTVSLIASNLSATARARTQESLQRQDELARLFDLSRDVLMATDSDQAIGALPQSVSRRFDLEYVAIALPAGDGWQLHEAGPVSLAIDHDDLSRAFQTAAATLEFDARARTYAGHRVTVVDGRSVRLVPLRAGTRPIGLLASAGRHVEPGTLEALAGVVAIAIERAHLLEERKSAELARRSDELKSTLLASLAHDLRTPLTAMRVAASNLQQTWLNDAERRVQSDIVLTEIERLTRLFQNILEMARIDAGPAAAETRWVHPSEIFAAARERVEPTTRDHALEIRIEPDTPVEVDPRAVATAIAYVLENAAQYSQAGASIDVDAIVNDEGLTVRVHDHGPGIATTDLPHVFDRFYRGSAAKTRSTGTGMGLAIARGLLASTGGRIWAANDPQGGAIFTIVVPARSRDAGTGDDT